MVHVMLFSHGFPFCCPDFLQEFSAGSMDKQFKLELCHQFLDCSHGSRSQGAEKSLVNWWAKDSVHHRIVELLLSCPRLDSWFLISHTKPTN